MDVIAEILAKSFPNFGYVIYTDSGGECVAVLGNHSVPKGALLGFREAIVRINRQMQEMYGQASLSAEQKRELAQQMVKMRTICSCRQEGLYTIEEQTAFISKLSPSEKLQLENQVKMLMDCRKFYKEYLREG